MLVLTSKWELLAQKSSAFSFIYCDRFAIDHNYIWSLILSDNVVEYGDYVTISTILILIQYLSY